MLHGLPQMLARLLVPTLVKSTADQPAALQLSQQSRLSAAPARGILGGVLHGRTPKQMQGLDRLLSIWAPFVVHVVTPLLFAAADAEIHQALDMMIETGLCQALCAAMARCHTCTDPEQTSSRDMDICFSTCALAATTGSQLLGISQALVMEHGNRQLLVLAKQLMPAISEAAAVVLSWEGDMGPIQIEWINTVSDILDRGQKLHALTCRAQPVGSEPALTQLPLLSCITGVPGVARMTLAFLRAHGRLGHETPEVSVADAAGVLQLWLDCGTCEKIQNLITTLPVTQQDIVVLAHLVKQHLRGNAGAALLEVLSLLTLHLSGNDAVAFWWPAAKVSCLILSQSCEAVVDSLALGGRGHASPAAIHEVGSGADTSSSNAACLAWDTERQMCITALGVLSCWMLTASGKPAGDMFQGPGQYVPEMTRSEGAAVGPASCTWPFTVCCIIGSLLAQSPPCTACHTRNLRHFWARS